MEARCAMLRSRCWIGVSRKGGGAWLPPTVFSGRETTERRREAGIEVVDAAAEIGVVEATGIGAVNGAGMKVVDVAGIGVIDEAGIGVVGCAGMGVVDDGGRLMRLG